MFRTYVLIAPMLLMALLSGACSMLPAKVALSDFPDDTSADMERAARMPTEAMFKASQDRAKVVLLRADQGGAAGSQGGQQAYRELTDALSREVEAILTANGVEIVDRSLADRLDQEIKMCELQGTGKCGSGMEPSAARYAIKASITNATYNPVFITRQQSVGGDGAALMLNVSYPGFVERHPVDGKNDILVVKPHFNHMAQVGTQIKVYELPSLREVSSVVGTGSQNQRTVDQAPIGGQLLVESMKAALSTNDTKVGLVNVFAPKGYVIGRRTSGKKTIFKISVGAGQGVVAFAPIVIASERTTVNPITNKESLELIDVVKGKVSDLVLPSESWVVVDDEEKAKKVSLGDQVIVKHEVSALSAFMKQLKQ